MTFCGLIKGIFKTVICKYYYKRILLVTINVYNKIRLLGHSNINNNNNNNSNNNNKRTIRQFLVTKVRVYK